MAKKLLMSNASPKIKNKWRSTFKNYPLIVDSENIDVESLAYIEEIHGNSVVNIIEPNPKDHEYEKIQQIYQGYMHDGGYSEPGMLDHYMYLRTDYIDVSNTNIIEMNIEYDFSETEQLFDIRECRYYDEDFNIIRIQDLTCAEARNFMYKIEPDVAYVVFVFYDPNPDSPSGEMYSPDWLKIKVRFHDEVSKIPLHQGHYNTNNHTPSTPDDAQHFKTIRTDLIDIRNFKTILMDIIEPNVNNIEINRVYLYYDDYSYMGSGRGNYEYPAHEHFEKESGIRYISVDFISPEGNDISPDDIEFNMRNKENRIFNQVDLIQGGLHPDGGISDVDTSWYNTVVRTDYIDLLDYTTATINVVTPCRHVNSWDTGGVYISYIAEFDENKEVVNVNVYDDYDDTKYSHYIYSKKPNVRYIVVDFEDVEHRSEEYEPGFTLRPDDVIVEVALNNASIIDLHQGGLHSGGTDIIEGEEYYSSTLGSDFIDLQDHTSVLLDIESSKDVYFGYIVLYDENKRFINYINLEGLYSYYMDSYLYERDRGYNRVRYIKLDVFEIDHPDIVPGDEQVVVTARFDIIPIYQMQQGYIYSADGSLSTSESLYHDDYVRSDYIDIENYYSVVISSLVVPDFSISAVGAYDKDKNLISMHYYERAEVNRDVYSLEYIKEKDVKYIIFDMYSLKNPTTLPDDPLVYVELKEGINLTPEVYQGNINETLGGNPFANENNSYHRHVARTDFIDLEGYPSVAIKVNSIPKGDYQIYTAVIVEFDQYKNYLRSNLDFQGRNHTDVVTYIKPMDVRYIIIGFDNFPNYYYVSPNDFTVNVSTFNDDLVMKPTMVLNWGLNGDGTGEYYEDYVCSRYVDVTNYDSVTIQLVDRGEFEIGMIDTYDEYLRWLYTITIDQVTNEYTFIKDQENVKYIAFDMVTDPEKVRIHANNPMNITPFLYQGWYDHDIGNVSSPSDSYHKYYVRTDFIPFKNKFSVTLTLNDGFIFSGLYVFDKNKRLIQHHQCESGGWSNVSIMKLEEYYFMADICYEDGTAITPDDGIELKISSCDSASILPSFNSHVWIIDEDFNNAGGIFFDDSITFADNDGYGPYMYVPESWKGNIIHLHAQTLKNVEIVLYSVSSGDVLLTLDNTDVNYYTPGNVVYIPKGDNYILEINHTNGDYAEVRVLEAVKVTSLFNEDDFIEIDPPNEGQLIYKLISNVGEPQDDGTYKVDISVCDNRFFFGRGGKKEW